MEKHDVVYDDEVDDDDDIASTSDDEQEQHIWHRECLGLHGVQDQRAARDMSQVGWAVSSSVSLEKIWEVGIGHDHDYQGNESVARWSQKTIMVLRNAMLIIHIIPC